MNKTIDLLCWKLENCVLISSKQSMVLLSLEICHHRGFQLQLKLVRNQRNKFRIRGFSLGIAESIHKSLSPAGQEFVFLVS